ncbi:hypothetical protein PVK62_08065 [Aliivibrio sp. S3MY1]|uniref:hypothetical protein n=1 Tax=unclassified Aliivibrio TaxID=2645654 RepID=UPI00237963E2|nr:MULTISPECIES: hypothetical protein [unclassified Aliivibrio]MDD9175995.1 hypothetical protein [Aliivibrio sp. S3TY1]MDD9193090.1 hypothetical protein [Aliivibrio sp. S2TY2]MDD9195794.1 hypothetical protein [Aliivibrio sp. S3MY1]
MDDNDFKQIVLTEDAKKKKVPTVNSNNVVIHGDDLGDLNDKVIVIQIPPQSGNQELPSLPDDTASEKPKRAFVIRGIRAVGRSLSNTVDDHTFRILRPSSPHNAVFIDGFIKSTYRDWLSLIDPDSETEKAIDKVRYLDEENRPFREIVSQLDNCNVDSINATQNAMLWCLGVSTVGVFYSLFKCLVSIMMLFMVSGSSLDLIVSFGMWLSFSMFAVFMYLYYGYHCWVLRRDKFGTFKGFLYDYRTFEMNAIFPYIEE